MTVDYDVRIEQHDSQPLAVVRRTATRAELPKVIPAACGLVWAAVRPLAGVKPGRHVTVYWDDVMNIEIGVEVDTPITDMGEVVASATPTGRVVTTTHFGPYQQLGLAHDAIHRWCKVNGVPLIRPCWEVYGHWLDEWNSDPSKIRTDVVYLIKDGP